MSLNDERRRILDLLAQQKITAAEAEDLLKALEHPPTTAVATVERPNYRYLRVKAVTKGVDTADVRIPLQLIKSGLRIATLLPRELAGEVESAVKDRTEGRIDLAKFRPEDIDELLESLNELEVTISATDTIIRVRCE